MLQLLCLSVTFAHLNRLTNFDYFWFQDMRDSLNHQEHPFFFTVLGTFN